MSGKLKFTKDPSKYKVVFDILGIEFQVGNLAAYKYNNNLPVVPVHEFGNIDPTGYNEGVLEVDGAVIFNVLNTDLERDLWSLLKILAKSEKAKDAAQISAYLSGNADISALKPEHIRLDNLPALDIKLEGEEDREIIRGVVFYESETSIGVKELGLKRITKFKATGVEQLDVKI